MLRDFGLCPNPLNRHVIMGVRAGEREEREARGQVNYSAPYHFSREEWFVDTHPTLPLPFLPYSLPYYTTTLSYSKSTFSLPCDFHPTLVPLYPTLLPPYPTTTLLTREEQQITPVTCE